MVRTRCYISFARGGYTLSSKLLESFCITPVAEKLTMLTIRVHASEAQLGRFVLLLRTPNKKVLVGPGEVSSDLIVSELLHTASFWEFHRLGGMIYFHLQVSDHQHFCRKPLSLQIFHPNLPSWRTSIYPCWYHRIWDLQRPT